LSSITFAGGAGAAARTREKVAAGAFAGPRVNNLDAAVVGVLGSVETNVAEVANGVEAADMDSDAPGKVEAAGAETGATTKVEVFGADGGADSKAEGEAEIAGSGPKDA
jgi:hypothetical protein